MHRRGSFWGLVVGVTIIEATLVGLLLRDAPGRSIDPRMLDALADGVLVAALLVLAMMHRI